MQICRSCYAELFDSDKECIKCHSQSLINSQDVKMCKEFFKYHDKDITKYTEYPYIAYLNYLEYKRAKEDAEYADLHCGESPKYHFGETVINTTKQQQQKYTPKCPTCGSPNIHKIGAGEKIVSGAFWGLFSNKIHKTYKCGNCGYLW